MPPIYPNIAKFETGRNSRITLPTNVCPEWFKSNLEVFFVPLFWKDDIELLDARRLEVMLVCTDLMIKSTDEWYINPTELITNELNNPGKPEEDKETIFVYKSKLTENKRQFKINCPPMIKGLCDTQGRLYVLAHSLGISIWSPPAFNEHFGKL